MSVALVSAATATATALTVGVEPPPAPVRLVSAERVDLAASTQLLPNHDQVPDITGGLGTTINDFNQAIAAQLIRALVSRTDFSAIGRALGLDALNVLNLNIPGVNVITAGPTFTVLKLLGVDLGWVPSLPNSVAQEINDSPYLQIGANAALNAILGGLLGPTLANLPTPLDLGSVIAQLTSLLDPITGQLPDVIDARLVPTIGIGLGAFAAAMAYDKVIADLKNQPGGSAYAGVNPLLGSLTILPLVLINNPARPDGGLFARFGDLAALFGINTVNPTTHATSENGTIPVLGSGLSLGGANILPILIDATYEYEPLSDFASWPNPVTLVNNLAASLFPTYLLRGLSLDGVADQLVKQLGNVSLDPVALNLYLTLHSSTLPMLEPLYLASDVLNIVGLSPLAQIPMRIANALAPALRILTDVGYANVVRNADGTYTRDFSTAGTEVPFLSFPNLNPLLVLGDTVHALFGGIQKELGPNPTPNTPNVLATLLNVIFGGGLGAILPSATAPASALATTTSPALSLTTPSELPAANARLLSITSKADTPASASVTTVEDASSTTDLAENQNPTPESPSTAGGGAVTPVTDKESAPAVGGEVTPAPDKEVSPAAGGEVTPAAGGEVTPAADKASTPAADKGIDKDAGKPKHAKPDSEDAGADSTTAPKHAKPTVNQIRDTANDFSPKSDEHGEKQDKAGAKSGTAPTGSETGSESASSAAA